MAARPEIVAVYTAAVIQGVALVTFPAASVVFTSASDYGLTSQQYGGMFVPQAITAVASSLLGAGLTRRFGAKRIYLLGLCANLLAMALLVCSRFFMSEHGFVYDLLLCATASMGLGFGFTVPALNTFAAAFYPQKVEKAVLALNALLGLGTMLAPILLLLFVGLGMWWGMPIFVATAILALLIFSTALPLDATQQTKDTETRQGDAKFPARFWAFAAFALLYGICETMNGNWASVYMKTRLGASTALASLALTVFWATVTAGRVLFAALDKWWPAKRVFRILPLVVATAFIVTACLQSGHPRLGLVAFAVAGLGCSALLPLVISFAQLELTGIAASVAGGLICVYQVGYGIAAFGVGPLGKAGLPLATIYGGAAAVALVMAMLSFVLVRWRRSPQYA
ncbi:MAG TPA: MFS transporter [Steroidobacteraceae bacterium]|jgi:MFS family permease|nr:MFS transporter [Steroidobacteraceae bacterium]